MTREELEQALAHERSLREAAEAEREAAEKERDEQRWSAANETDLAVKMSARADRAEAERDAMQVERDDARWVADERRVKLEAAEAAFHTVDADNLVLLARAEAAEAERDEIANVSYLMGFKNGTAKLENYATRLLAALTQQRQALEEVHADKKRHYHTMPNACALCIAIATDHAALVSEAEALGVEVQE